MTGTIMIRRDKCRRVATRAGFRSGGIVVLLCDGVVMTGSITIRTDVEGVRGRLRAGLESGSAGVSYLCARVES